MKIIISAKLVIACAVLASCFSAVSEDQIDKLESRVETMIEDYSEICFGVEALDGGWGSAVLISEDGTFLTSAHIFQSVGESVILHQVGKPKISARVVRFDSEIDIALVQADDFSGRAAEYTATLKRPSVKAGEAVEVVAFGHASGFREGRKAPSRFGFAYENTDGDVISTCRLTIGDSGGVLLSLDGSLLGIHRTVDRKGDYATHVSVATILEIWPDIEGSNS